MLRAFFLWTAYWRPEINLVAIDLNETRKLKQEKTSMCMLLVVHELLHMLGTGRRLQDQSGLVLNISNLAFENVRNIFATKDRNIGQIKENIIKTEMACDNLFISSHSLLESLNAYQMKVGLDQVLEGRWLDISLGKQLKEMFRADFGKTVERIKYFTLRELARIVARDKELGRLLVPKGIVKEKLKESEVLIKKLLRKSFREDEARIIQQAKHDFDSALSSFASSVLSREKERLDIYNKLMKLKEKADSFMFSDYVCSTALDIPFCPNPEDLIFSVPLQYNPKRRFYRLYKKLSQLNGKKLLRNLSIIRRLAEEERRDEIGSATVQEIGRFLTEKTGLLVYDHYGLGTPKVIPFCESFIPFRSCIEKARKGEIRRRLFMEGFRKGAELSKAKSLEKEVASLVKLGFLPFLMVTSDKWTRILFSSEYKNDNLWKLWWCLNNLKDQMICGMSIFNPLDLGYFDAPDHLYRQVEQAVKLAKRFESVGVSDWLWKRFVKSSRTVGRPLVSE